MLDQDKQNGFGTDIAVVVQPRNDEEGAGDRWDIPGYANNSPIPFEDSKGDMDGINGKKRISPTLSVESRHTVP